MFSVDYVLVSLPDGGELSLFPVAESAEEVAASVECIVSSIVLEFIPGEVSEDAFVDVEFGYYGHGHLCDDANHTEALDIVVEVWVF
jgi:hypothetical protein